MDNRQLLVAQMAASINPELSKGMEHGVFKSPYQQFQQQYPALDEYSRDVLSGRRFEKTVTDFDELANRAMAGDQQAGEEFLGHFGFGGMTLFHGSPHKFAKFSTKNIGTGEGAQAYGHGLYFAESKDVAKSYQQALPHNQVRKDFLNALPEDAEFDELIDLLGTGHFNEPQERVIKALEADDWLGFDYPSQAISASYRNLDNYDPSPALRNAIDDVSHMYKVDVPDEHIKNFLDWDAPLSQQPDSVKKAINMPQYWDARTATGGDYYKHIAKGGIEADVSETLSNQGVKGIKYYDAGSRGAGEGTRNLVVFDDSIIKATHRNDISLTQQEFDDGILEAIQSGNPESILDLVKRQPKP